MRFPIRAGLLVAVAFSPLLAADNAGFDDELSLRSLGLSADGPDLVAFFKNRTATQADAEKLSKLIDGLRDKDRDARRKAFQELAGLGALAVPSLRAAVVMAAMVDGTLRTSAWPMTW